MKSRKYKRINSGIDKFHRLFIKAVTHIHCEYLRCLNRKRAVKIHIKIFILRKKMPLFDLPDKIKHLLSSSNGKRRNHNIASPVKRLFDNPGKISEIIRFFCCMYPVSVSRLHNDIIRRLCITWIFNDRLVYISDIS